MSGKLSCHNRPALIFLVAALSGCAQTQALPQVADVWNRVYPVNMTPAVVRSAGPGGHIVLHLDGIKAVADIDDIRVFMNCLVTEPDLQIIQGHASAGTVVIGNVGFAGDWSYDVTDKMRTLETVSPVQFNGFVVEFVVTPKNHQTRLNAASIHIDQTYFAITDANDKPVPQEHVVLGLDDSEGKSL